MISVEAALKIVLKGVQTLDPENVAVKDSLGRVLAQDISSEAKIPSFDNSAMDGYAVKCSDTLGANEEAPKRLEVLEDLRAGFVSRKELNNGQAVRIMTGAPIPSGADSVIMVEDTKADGNYVDIFKSVRRRENIRRAGEDIKKGETVLKKGTLLRSAHMGLMASLGVAGIKVTKRPMVAVLATGDELVAAGRKLTPGKLYSSNTYSLCGQISSCGGTPKDLGIARDAPGDLRAKIRSGLSCDLILTSGGVSVGDYDLVKSVLAGMGTDIKFWKVAMRPGKPLAFGRINGTPVFGLPGNPVSSMVSFEVFVRPVIMKMLGRRQQSAGDITATLEENISKKKGLSYFLRAVTRWDGAGYLTRTTGPQGSGILKSMALANSFIIIPEKEEQVGRGRKVAVRFLEN